MLHPDIVRAQAATLTEWAGLWDRSAEGDPDIEAVSRLLLRAAQCVAAMRDLGRIEGELPVSIPGSIRDG